MGHSTGTQIAYPFSNEEAVYFVATFAAISSHSSWVDWVRFYGEHVDCERYFERRTFEAFVEALAQQAGGLAHESTDVLFSVMPRLDGQRAAGEGFVTAPLEPVTTPAAARPSRFIAAS